MTFLSTFFYGSDGGSHTSPSSLQSGPPAPYQRHGSFPCCPILCREPIWPLPWEASLHPFYRIPFFPLCCQCLVWLNARSGVLSGSAFSASPGLPFSMPLPPPEWRKDCSPTELWSYACPVFRIGAFFSDFSADIEFPRPLYIGRS